MAYLLLNSIAKVVYLQLVISACSLASPPEAIALKNSRPLLIQSGGRPQANGDSRVFLRVASATCTHFELWLV